MPRMSKNVIGGQPKVNIEDGDGDILEVWKSDNGNIIICTRAKGSHPDDGVAVAVPADWLFQAIWFAGTGER